MSAPLAMCLVAPLAGAVLATALADVPKQRRATIGIAVAAMLGGAAWTVYRSVDTPVVLRSFVADPWRAVLLAGALLSVAAAAARVARGADASTSLAAILAAGAAGVGPLLVWGSHELAITLLVSTAGVAVVALVRAGSSSAAYRARRACVALLASDVLALVALGASLDGGVRLPPDISGAAGAVLLAAAAVRLGLAPFAFGADDAAAADAALGAIWLGPVRAQGMLLAVFAISSDPWVAYAAAGAAAATALAHAVRAASSRDGIPIATAAAAVALFGFAIGGATASTGATIALAAAFLVWPMWLAGGSWADGARPTLAGIPLGGTLAGSILVVSAALGAAAARPAWLSLGVPVLAATGALATAAWIPQAGARRGDPMLSGLVAALALAAASTLSAVPARVSGALAGPVVSALGVGRPLGARQFGVAEDLALVVAIAGVVALIAGPGRLSRGGPASSGRRPGHPERWAAWWAAAPGAAPPGTARAEAHARNWRIAAIVLAAGAFALALRVFLAAAGRGFL